jgi:LuxR family quorum-sensing transcriptional regulator LasR
MARLIEAKRRNQPLEPVMAKIMQSFGFESFLYGMSANAAPHRRENRAYVWTTLPKEWVQRYATMGYIEIDPRITETYNRNVPFVWDAQDYSGNETLVAFFADAARFGVCSGVSISFRDPDHGRVLCAFNSSITPVDAARLAYVYSRLGDLLLFSTLFHDFFMAHFVDSGPVLASVAPLSVRERQCLELAARGLTSSDIGDKLGITGRTANFHVSNVIKKTGVLNRKEAIAVAIARGWVQPHPVSLTSGHRPIRKRAVR